MASTASHPVPRPRMSRRRWYLIGGFLLLVIATPFLYCLFAALWSDYQMEAIYREMDAADPNWRWADLVAELKPPPDDANSAVQIVKIHELLKTTPFSLNPKWHSNKPGPLDIPNAKLTAEHAGYLQFAFSKLDPKVLEEARRLKDLPEGRFALDPEATPSPMVRWRGTPVPEHQAWTAAVDLLHNDVIMRAENGDIEGAAESCQALLNAIRAFKDWPARDGQGMRSFRQITTSVAVERMLGQGDISEAMLEKLHTLFEQEIADDGMYIGMRGARASAHHTYLQLRSGETSFLKMIQDSGDPAFVGVILNVFQGVLLDQYPDLLRKMNELVPATKLKDRERVDAIRRIEERRERERGILTNVLFHGYWDTTDHAQATMRCAVAGIAAERYRLKHDFWPEGMDDLVKEGLLKGIPKDPHNGQPLRWKRTATGIMIYCRGYDEIDHGGKLDRSAGSNLPGFDIGFELWAHRHRQLPAPVINEEK